MSSASLREGTSIEAVQAKLSDFVRRNYGDDLKDPPRSYALELEPIAEAYHSPAGRRLRRTLHRRIEVAPMSTRTATPEYAQLFHDPSHADHRSFVRKYVFRKVSNVARPM